MAGEERHSIEGSTRKHHGASAGEGRETVERATHDSAREQLRDIADGASERARRYGVRQQPAGQPPPRKSNIEND